MPELKLIMQDFSRRVIDSFMTTSRCRGSRKNIADMAQQFTQYAGVRPFGVALILAGVDKNGASLYLTIQVVPTLDMTPWQ